MKKLNVRNIMEENYQRLKNYESLGMKSDKLDFITKIINELFDKLRKHFNDNILQLNINGMELLNLSPNVILNRLFESILDTFRKKNTKYKELLDTLQSDQIKSSDEFILVLEKVFKTITERYFLFIILQFSDLKIELTMDPDKKLFFQNIYSLFYKYEIGSFVEISYEQKQ